MIALGAALFVTGLGTVVGTVLAMEAWASAPHLSRRLLRETIEQFPDRLAEERRSRWTEELEADLGAYEDRRLAGLRFAVRLRLQGGRDLAAELAVAELMASAPDSGRLEGPEPEPFASLDRAFRRGLERRLEDLSIADLAALAKEQTGLSLEEIATPRNDQHHLSWRRAIQARLAVDEGAVLRALAQLQARKEEDGSNR